jgi:hypothetical protein
MGVVLTRWHWAAQRAEQEIAGHRPPCAGRTDLLRPGGRGEHLCRLCLNCGYGWLEACTGQGTVPPAPPAAAALPPAACAGLSALAGTLACTGADVFLGSSFRGPALAVMQLAAAVVIAMLIAVGSAVLAAPDPQDASLSLRKAVPCNAGPGTGRARAWRAAASLRRNVRQLFPAPSRDSREVRS